MLFILLGKGNGGWRMKGCLRMHTEPICNDMGKKENVFFFTQCLRYCVLSIIIVSRLQKLFKIKTINTIKLLNTWILNDNFNCIKKEFILYLRLCYILDEFMVQFNIVQNPYLKIHEHRVVRIIVFQSKYCRVIVYL